MTPLPSQDKESLRAPSPRATASRWEIFGWCMFDFANSSFTTVIVTVVFAVYFTKVICYGRDDADWLWGLAQAVSQGVVLVLAPFLGALADFSGAKKRFLMCSWVACCLATALLYVPRPGQVSLAFVLFVFANIAFSAGENFNASFLPELATPEDTGKVSGYGWALGYLGGLLALLLCSPFTTQGFTVGNAPNLRFTCIITGLFFFLAGIPTMLLLKERGIPEPLAPGERMLTIGFRRVTRTLREIRRFRQLFRFLFVFAIYNTGLCAVTAFVSIYAEKTVGFNSTELSMLFILLQISCAVGAFALGFFQDRFGAKAALSLSLVIWIVVCIGASATTDKAVFFLVGNLAGLALGSSQSGARALVALMAPPSRSAEFFGFWGLFWKFSSALGPLVFGVLSSALSAAHGVGNGQRLTVLANSGLFLIGLILLQFIDVKEGREAAVKGTGATSQEPVGISIRQA